MGEVMAVNTKVKIVSAMSSEWVGKEAFISRVVSTNPICYELNIGGGHWLNSCLMKVS